MRTFLLRKHLFKTIEAFPQKDDPKNRVFLDAKLSTCIYVITKSIPTSFYIKVHPGKDILNDTPLVKIEPEQIEVFDITNLSIPSYPNMTSADFNLALKLIQRNKGICLNHYATSQQGEVNLTTHSEFLSDTPIGRLVLRGAHIGRYEFQEEPKQGIPKYLDDKRFLAAHAPKTKAYDYIKIRIGYQRGSAIDNWRRIIATIIPEGSFCSDTINYIVNPQEINLYAVLGFLNSSLWEWRFRLTSTNNHINSYEIDGMSIRRISFTTPPDRRAALVEQAKALYSNDPAFKYGDFVGAQSADNLDRMDSINASNPVHPVQTDASLSTAPDSQKILEFVCARLSAVPEESDVVHDLLAYLAQRMIEMNKEKNVEIKGFLLWLEGEIGAPVEELTNKTAIKEYYEAGFDALAGALAKNKKKLKDGYDPTRREPKEKLQEEFNTSVGKLAPLLKRIEKTDKLIDQIVYKLYGLTEDEIKIVEESISGGKDL